MLWIRGVPFSVWIMIYRDDPQEPYPKIIHFCIIFPSETRKQDVPCKWA